MTQKEATERLENQVVPRVIQELKAKHSGFVFFIPWDDVKQTIREVYWEGFKNAQGA